MRRVAIIALALGAALAAGYVLSPGIARKIMFQASETKGPSTASRPLVEVSEPKTRQFRDTLKAIATTKARRSIEVYPSTSGRVTWIGIEAGKAMRQGDLLLRLDDAGQDAIVRQAEASVAETKARHERMKQLSANNAVSASETEAANAAWLRAQADLELARNNHRDRRVLAAFDGVVGLTSLRVGSRVETATLVTTLDDLSAVEVSFSVPERYLAKVKIGQPVELRTEVYPQRVFKATLSAVDTRIDPVSRVLSLRAVVPNGDGALVGGMLVDASLLLGMREALTVPSHAVLVEGDRSHVFVVGNGKAEKKEVRIGATVEDLVELLAGVENDSQVVTSGLHQVSEGVEVEIKGSQGGEGVE